MITATHPLSVHPVAMSMDQLHRYTVDIESYSPNFAILRASGDLDMSARMALMDKLEQLLALGADVVVDLSGVAFMYSGAANAVIDAASVSETVVRIFAPTRPVRMIFEALGAQDLIVDHLPGR
ncbi:STAS domain-containing protein [Rhodococcus sp. G-MC3]|uniref:STAS domain-containing protein n=1 Tax=Rhodococcus sp. G-MC3 TaxID=3046209 RepID=UPI0024BA4681|nr:STAS domain-containing protein [Rhodococcus sp. G-MC3]MDJ0396341.1 STAS domain-containing protein [Rhodococcus sp. G-MC3]